MTTAPETPPLACPRCGRPAARLPLDLDGLPACSRCIRALRRERLDRERAASAEMELATGGPVETEKPMRFFDAALENRKCAVPGCGKPIEFFNPDLKAWTCAEHYTDMEAEEPGK